MFKLAVEKIAMAWNWFVGVVLFVIGVSVVTAYATLTMILGAVLAFLVVIGLCVAVFRLGLKIYVGDHEITFKEESS